MAVPMTVALEGAAGNLVPTGYERTVINLTVNNPIAGLVVPQIPAMSKWILEFINDSIPLVIDGMEPDFIDEDEKKPQDYMAFDYADLCGEELALLTGSKDLLLQNSTVPIEPLIALEAAKGYSRKLDKVILGLGTPAGWGATGSFKLAAEAAVGNVFDGSDYDDVCLFFSAMLGELEDNENYNEATTRWFVRTRMKQALRDARTEYGAPLLVTDLRGDSGLVQSIYGVPVTWVPNSYMPLHTSGAPIDVFGADMSKVAIGVKPDGISYASSNVASYTSAATGELVSAFENDETVYRWVAIYAFNVVDEEAVVEGFTDASSYWVEEEAL